MPTHNAFRGAPSEHDCFADEVAIDFLSVAVVVERMRAAFFRGEEEPPSPHPRASIPAHGLGSHPDP
jgi:hypothetical protein